MKKIRPEWEEIKAKYDFTQLPSICVYGCQGCTQEIPSLDSLMYHYNLGHFDYEEEFKIMPEHEDHLNELLKNFQERFQEKYRKGVRSHAESEGGLWKLTPLQLIDNAIDENLDQFAYLMTLRSKLEIQERQGCVHCKHTVAHIKQGDTYFHCSAIGCSCVRTY